MKRTLHVVPHTSRYRGVRRWCVRFHKSARAYMVFPDRTSALQWARATRYRLVIHNDDGTVERVRE